MEKQIIKNLFSQKDLSEENLKEFLKKKSNALEYAEEDKDKFKTTYQALFDVGLFENEHFTIEGTHCLLYTSPSPRDATLYRMPSSA